MLSCKPTSKVTRQSIKSSNKRSLHWRKIPVHLYVSSTTIIRGDGIYDLLWLVFRWGVCITCYRRDLKKYASIWPSVASKHRQRRRRGGGGGVGGGIRTDGKADKKKRETDKQVGNRQTTIYLRIFRKPSPGVRNNWHSRQGQSINQSIKQSINKSVNQSINQSVSQSISQSVNQSINQSIHQASNQSTNFYVDLERKQRKTSGWEVGQLWGIASRYDLVSLWGAVSFKC